MKRSAVALIVAIAALALIFGPWLCFWAIGVLFDWHIAFTFKTWFAAWVLVLALRSGSEKAGP